MTTYKEPHYAQLENNQYFQLKYKDLNLVMIFVFRCGESASCSDMSCDSMTHRETVFKVKRINADDSRTIIKSNKGTNKITFNAKALNFKESIYKLDLIELNKMFEIINKNWEL